MNTQRRESCVRSDNKHRHNWMTIPKKKQDILGWDLTKLQKFRISKLPYFCNVARELYIFRTSGFWNLWKWHSISDTFSLQRSTHTSSPTQTHIALSDIIAACSENRGNRWRSWLRHCATSQKVAGSIPDSVIAIFYCHNPSGHVVDSISNRNEYQGYFLGGGGGEGGRGVGLTSLPPSCSDCLEIWEPQLSETLRASTGFALPFALEIVSNGQILSVLNEEFAMSSTCTCDCYACPLEQLMP